MSGSPRTLFAAVLAVGMLAVVGCSAESSSSNPDDDASSAAADSTAQSGGGTEGEPGGAGGNGTDAESDENTDDPADDPTDESDGERSLRNGAEKYLRDAARALRAGGKSGDGVDETATGPALDAALAQAAEFNDNGWHQVGAPRIVSTRIVEDERDGDPPRITIAACVDSSKVEIVDASGESVRPDSHPDRAQMRYTLVRMGGDWLVERETFPDNPDC